MVLTTDKLTWSVAAEQLRPSFTVTASAAGERVTSVKVNADSRMLKKHETQNVLAFLEGASNDSLIVITAHYDHLGMMGSGVIFPGANDNASGVAMMLSMAQYFSHHKPKYTTVLLHLPVKRPDCWVQLILSTIPYFR
ncbi:MAG: M28 family peptidase [Bacteroidia bacterium]|nr:M28 family peptidase [Bacteroidia bacterium]